MHHCIKVFNLIAHCQNLCAPDDANFQVEFKHQTKQRKLSYLLEETCSKLVANQGFVDYTGKCFLGKNKKSVFV